METYKNSGRVYIGTSDIAALVLRSPDAVAELKFGEDASYYAYECFGDVEIGAHYKKVFEGEHWLCIYDDEGRTYNCYPDCYTHFAVYRAGERGCIIHWFNRPEEED